MTTKMKHSPGTNEIKRILYELVADAYRSHGPESGLCIHCGAVVESSESGVIEFHDPACPWMRARVLLGIAEVGTAGQGGGVVCLPRAA